MRNALVVGGAGFLGSNLVKKLCEKNVYDEIHILEPEFSNVSRLDGCNVIIHRGVLIETDKIVTIISSFKISVIVHLVSTLVPGSTYDDYEREYKNVIFPSIRLMQICCKKQIKFVYFSSGGTIYGNRSTIEPFRESDPMQPISFYGWSKQMMENSILFVHRTEGLEYLILRPSNPYGYGQNLYGKQGFIAVSIGNILDENPIEVWGDGSSIRDYIYIDDLSEICVKLLSKSVSNTTLNIGSGIGYSNTDVLKILRNVVDENIGVKYLSARRVDVSNMILDNRRLLAIIGDYQFVGLEEGVRLFYNSIKHIVNR